MPLSDKARKNINAWFDGNTKEVEYAWAERLQEVAPIYEEMGFTRGEGAVIFMLSQILGQVASINHLLARWDEEDE